MKRKINQCIRGLVFVLISALAGTAPAYASDGAVNLPTHFEGNNDWLFYGVEFTDANDLAATRSSIELIRRFNRVLERNGITLVFAMVPIKARIYEKHLPPQAVLNPHMASNYDRIAEILRSGHVKVIDLNGPFLNDPKRDSDTPLYLRLDTHWSPSGALLAAEVIRSGIEGDPVLRTVFSKIPNQKFSIHIEKKSVKAQLGDIATKLLNGSRRYTAEPVLSFQVWKEDTTPGNLLGEGESAEITLMGSSYSAPWYRLPDALRFTLQKNILAISVEAIQGSWFGMESYLRNDSFQSNKPKLLIWEVPERDMSKPPNFKFRDLRYQSDNDEWLLRVAALVQGTCMPSRVNAKVSPGSLLADATGNIIATNTSEQDFVELKFDAATDNLDYLVASVATNGSKKLLFEASGPGVESRWFDVPVPGDGLAHMLKTPFPTDGNGFTTVRIFPGKSKKFSASGIQICRQAVNPLH